MNLPFQFSTVASGIGAPEMAWVPLGWNPVFSAEIEPFPSAVLKIRHGVPNYGDINKFKEWPNERTVDLVCAGCPCQAFSIAGLRKGLDDPRGNLTLVFLGILEKYRPRWVVYENVPGIFSEDTRALESFCDGLQKIGYGISWTVLDAEYFGVPQRRERIFIVGYLGDWRPAAAVLFDKTCLLGYPAPNREKGKGFAADVTPCLESSGRWVERAGESRGQDPVIAHTTGAGYWKEGAGTLRGRKQDSHENLCFDMRGNGNGETVNNITGDHASRTTDYTPVVLAHGKGNGEVVKDGSPSLTCNHEAPICFNSRQDCISSTETVRRLTPRECERLQGFPDDYTLITYKGKPAADGPRYKALGNSMAVPVMRWIGERIQMVDALK